MNRIGEMVAGWLVPHIALRVRYDELERHWKERGQTIFALHACIAAQKKEIALQRAVISKLKSEVKTTTNKLELVISDGKPSLSVVPITGADA